MKTGDAKEPAGPARPVSVFIVDDHPIVRNGLRTLIEGQGDLKVVGEADDAEKALAGFAAEAPRVALVDISLKGMDGLDLIKHAKPRFPDIAFLVVSMHDENLYAERALRAGAGGYVMKQEAAEKVVLAIRRILRGETYLSDRMFSLMVKKMTGDAKPAEMNPLAHLSDRELEVFTLMGQGKRIKDIAEMLSISSKTVESHCSGLRKKLAVKGVFELMQYAIRWTHANQKPA